MVSRGYLVDLLSQKGLQVGRGGLSFWRLKWEFWTNVY